MGMAGWPLLSWDSRPEPPLQAASMGLGPHSLHRASGAHGGASSGGDHSLRRNFSPGSLTSLEVGEAHFLSTWGGRLTPNLQAETTTCLGGRRGIGDF